MRRSLDARGRDRLRGPRPGARPSEPGRVALRRGRAGELIWRDLYRVTNMRTAFNKSRSTAARWATAWPITTLVLASGHEEVPRAGRGRARELGTGPAYQPPTGAHLRQALERVPVGEQGPRRRARVTTGGQQVLRARRGLGAHVPRRRCTRSGGRSRLSRRSRGHPARTASSVRSARRAGDRTPPEGGDSPEAPDVEAAASVIGGRLLRTPLLSSETLGRSFAVRAFLKLELLQKTAASSRAGCWRSSRR